VAEIERNMQLSFITNMLPPTISNSESAETAGFDLFLCRFLHFNIKFANNTV